MEVKKLGSIKLILGCMFSGKTTELQREFREWSSINKAPLCINYIDDNRYGNIMTNMYNHNEIAVSCVKARNLKDVDDSLIKNSEIILINEGQFFSDLIEFCLLWCEEYGKDIIVCGLDGDFMRKPFGKILELIPYSDSVVKLTAYCKVCSDGTKGIFNLTENQQKKNKLLLALLIVMKHYVENVIEDHKIALTKVNARENACIFAICSRLREQIARVIVHEFTSKNKRDYFTLNFSLCNRQNFMLVYFFIFRRKRLKIKKHSHIVRMQKCMFAYANIHFLVSVCFIGANKRRETKGKKVNIFFIDFFN